MKGILLDSRPEKNKEILNLSVSKLKTFEDCKTKFKFSYIDKLPKKEWEFHSFGKFLHAVLEYFHLQYNENPDQPLNLIMKDSYSKAKKAYESKLSQEKNKEIWELCFTYLKNISEKRKNNTLSDFLAAEKEFNVNIDNTILLNGFIDKIQLDQDKILHVADYKTSKNDSYLKNDFFQLKTYAYVMFLTDPSLKKVRTSYIMAKMGFKEIVKEFTLDDVKEVEDYYLEKAALIRTEAAFKPSPSRLCDYCDYLENCHDGAKFLGSIAPKQTKITPVEKDNTLYYSSVNWFDK
jgi:putative RecB family exonuclease